MVSSPTVQKLRGDIGSTIIKAEQAGLEADAVRAPESTVAPNLAKMATDIRSTLKGQTR